MTDSRWRLIPLARSLADHAVSWDELNRRIMGDHPLLDSRFIDPLLQYLGDGSEHLCLLERRGVIQGMCLMRPAKTGIWNSFFPPLCPVGPTIVADSKELSRLPSDLPGWVIRVDFLGQDPDFSPALDRWPVPRQRREHALTIRIQLSGDFDTYWKGRSKKLRETIRGRENRVQRANLTPRLVCHESERDILSALERFEALEWSGWKGREGSALGRGNPQGKFYQDMMKSFARAGQGMVYEYWLDDRLAASQLAIANNRMIVALKIAYDETLGSFSPGRLLLREFIRAAFSRMPGGALEGYTDAGPDLLAWATHQRWIEHISLYRSQQIKQAISTLRAARTLAQWVFTRINPLSSRTT